MPKSFPGQVFCVFSWVRFFAAALALDALISTAALPLSAQEPNPKPPESRLLVRYPDLNAMTFLDPEGPPLPKGTVARIGSPRFRHGRKISALAYSPDGKWLASASAESDDPKVVVWDDATGRPVFSFPLAIAKDAIFKGPNPIRCMEFSHDGRLLILALPEEMQVWDITLKELKLKTPLPQSKLAKSHLVHATLSPDFQNLVLLWLNGTLEVRSVAEGKVLRQAKLDFGYGMQWKLRFFPKGSKLVLENRELEPMPVYEWPSLTRCCEIKVPQADTTLNQNPQKPAKIAGVLFGDNDQSFFFGVSKHGQIGGELFHVNLTTQKIQSHKQIPARDFQWEILPDRSKILCWDSESKHNNILDVRSFQLLAQIPLLFFKPTVVAIQGNRLACSPGYDGIIQVVDLGTHQFHPHCPIPGQRDSVQFSPDGSCLVLERMESAPWVNWKTGKTVRSDAADVFGVTSGKVAISRNGQVHAYLLPATLSPKNQRLIRVIFAETGKQLDLPYDPDLRNLQLVLSGNGKRLIGLVWGESPILFSSGTKGTGLVWDLEQGRLLHRIPIPADFGNGPFQLSFDGKILVRCKRDSEICRLAVLSVDSGDVVREWDTPTKWNLGLAISPNNQLLAGGGTENLRTTPRQKENNGTVWIWEIATARMIHELAGHQPIGFRGGVECDFSFDCRLLATGDDAGVIRIWEPSTGELMLTLEGHRRAVKPRFSPNGRMLVSTSVEAPCYVWELFPQMETPFDPNLTWNQLGSEDGKIAFHAIRAMVSYPEKSLAMLTSRTKEDSTDKKQVAKWLANLDTDDFSDREEAEGALTKIAGSIEPELRKTLTVANPEVRKRLERILASIKQRTPESIRRTRVCIALTRIGSAEAKKQLAFWE